MKYLLVAAFALLYVKHVTAGFGAELAGAIGVEVPEECKQAIKKWSEIAEKETYKDFVLKEICEARKCSAAYKKIAKSCWPKVKDVAEGVFKEIVKKGGPNVRKLVKKCAPFNPDVAKGLWKMADEVAEKCALAAKSVAMQDFGDKDPCEITKKQIEKTGECIKGEIIGRLMPGMMPRMGPLQDCANEALKEYCTKEKIDKIAKYLLLDARKDSKIMGPLNAFKLVREHYKKCEPCK